MVVRLIKILSKIQKKGIIEETKEKLDIRERD